MILLSHQIVPVKPMQKPIGLAYALRYVYNIHPDIYTDDLYNNGFRKRKHILCWRGKNNPLKVNNLKIKNRNKRIYKWLTKNE